MGCGCGKAKVMPANQNNNRQLNQAQSFSINQTNMETIKVKYLGTQQSPFIVTGQITGTHYKFAAPAANMTSSQNETQMIKAPDLPFILTRKDRSGNKMFAVVTDLTQEIKPDVPTEITQDETVTQSETVSQDEVSFAVATDVKPKRGRKAKEA